MTTSEPFDWSQLPPSRFGDDAFVSMILPDEINKLKRLHGVICRWREVADEELKEFERTNEQKRNSAWAEYGHGPVQDEAFILLETERAMYASLGVAIASTAENLIIRIGEVRGLPHSKGNKTDFSVALNSLRQATAEAVSDLPGYSGNQRARKLGNCFKHCEGKANEEFAAKYNVGIGETIEYEQEDWVSMIVDTETLLLEIIQRLKPE